MAPLKPVLSLVELSVTAVVLSFDLIQEKDVDICRQVILTTLPGSVRQVILDRATKRYKKPYSQVIHALKLVGDSSIRNLKLDLSLYPNSPWDSWATCSDFHNALNNFNLTGLHELQVKGFKTFPYFDEVVKGSKNHPRERWDLMCPNPGLKSALERGLAANLTHLTLENVADNETLAILGRSALRLKFLDVSNSWDVRDEGVAALLFKDPEKLWSILDMWRESLIFSPIMDQVPSVQCNKTCETLTEIRLQDTNTSLEIVILILFFAKNLKSFGGFLYGRNIGDVIYGSQELHPLELTELQDMELPTKKFGKIIKHLPKLQHLYTRAAFLPDRPGLLPTSLTKISLDFNMSTAYDSSFFHFLTHHGRLIKSINLIDQRSFFDLGIIADSCPLLEELEASVSIISKDNRRGLMPNLVRATIEVSSPAVFLWFVNQVDNIQELRVRSKCLITGFSGLDDKVINSWIDAGPKSLQSIVKLDIQMRREAQYFRSIEEKLTIQSAYAICNSCSSLRELGSLNSWSVDKIELEEFRNHIKKSNWDVKLKSYLSDRVQLLLL